MSWVFVTKIQFGYLSLKFNFRVSFVGNMNAGPFWDKKGQPNWKRDCFKCQLSTANSVFVTEMKDQILMLPDYFFNNYSLQWCKLEDNIRKYL